MQKDRFFEILDYSISPPEFLVDPILKKQFKYKTPLHIRNQKKATPIISLQTLVDADTTPKEKIADVNQQKVFQKSKFMKMFRFWNRFRK